MNLRPQKSFRALLILWFIIFSVVPVSFVTGYSLVRFEHAIDQELSERLTANVREIESFLEDYQFTLTNEIRSHASDKSFVYYLSSNNLATCREIVSRWMLTGSAQEISIFDRSGDLKIAMKKNGTEPAKRLKKRERATEKLPAEMVLGLRRDGQKFSVEINEAENPALKLVLDRTVTSTGGIVIGFLREILIVDAKFIEQLKNRLEIEMFFFRGGNELVVSSREELALTKASFFKQQLIEAQSPFFEMVLKSTPFQFSLSQLSWGDSSYFLGLGASKERSQAVMSNVNFAFVSVLGSVIVLLVILSLITSKIILRPLNNILDGLKKIQLSDEPVELPEDHSTEFGLLSTSFNEMSRKIFEAQQQLRTKIAELESANQEIRETQERLVQAAKMASLGQLVAGVAHELNNPIGFIYSNMTHLREYSEKLTNMIEELKSGTDSFSELNARFEFDFIKQDLPKLIRSCEEGARRTRDIVLGLRNFSRLESAQLSEIHLHQNLDETVQLLSGQIKDRILIKKNYDSRVKLIEAYPTQLGQVFMNILTNASQAIVDRGTITIETRLREESVEIHISDDGPGMDSETLSKVFDPFFTTKTIGEGTGLGLSISYGIVEKHGGTITVSSELGCGTTFTVMLPIRRNLGQAKNS